MVGCASFGPELIGAISSNVHAVRLVVLGGSGSWPQADQACSGYLVEHDGFRLLVDPGYATLPVLLTYTGVDGIDAVLISHGHPDHCADLSPLLRARFFADEAQPPLPIFALRGAVDPVLALDGPGALSEAFEHTDLTAGDAFTCGPFEIDTLALPHFVPNVGFRITAGGRVLAYTGDSGPTVDLIDLARFADLFLAEATYPEEVPDRHAPYLSSARQAGQVAGQSDVGYLLLTHLWPGTNSRDALEAARQRFSGEIAVSVPGLTVDLD
jgi:ribonuclease BN (tRNA processing enzyme)